jgi:myo-inositol-1(or 4)-monophosphatase
MKTIDISAVARALAIEAGELMLGERERAQLSYSFKKGTELVTSADLAVDQLISAKIKQKFPEHVILSEESSPDIGRVEDLSSPLWIIDPIDGTVNYAHGHNQSAVSIAYADDGDIEVGVVLNPFTNELFSAIKGKGALLNGQSIKVAQENNVERAIVATGFPYEKSGIKPMIERVGAILNHCADIRRLGSAALDICWVASGRLDAYYESLNLWDFAAARLIASEAGAKCGHFSEVPVGRNAQFYENDLLISNPSLYPKILAILEAVEHN